MTMNTLRWNALGSARKVICRAAKAAVIGIRGYVRLTTPEPHVLRAIGEESQRKGTDTLTSRQIGRVIKAARARKTKRA